jgi:hypothetical protein
MARWTQNCVHRAPQQKILVVLMVLWVFGGVNAAQKSNSV